jgi:hypothetical protein
MPSITSRAAPSVFYALAVFGVGSLFGFTRRMKSGRIFLLLLLAVLLSVPAVGLLGCGVSAKNVSGAETEPTTPLSTSKVTVIATAGAFQQTTTFMLSVQEGK